MGPEPSETGVGRAFRSFKDRVLRREDGEITQSVQRLRARIRGLDRRTRHLEQSRATTRADVRALRSRLRDTRDEVRYLKMQVDVLSRVIIRNLSDSPDGAERLTDALQLNAPATAGNQAAGALQVQLLTEAGFALEADRLVAEADLIHALPLKIQRALGRLLRDRGYLARALAYSEAAVLHGNPNDEATGRFRLGQADVLSGAFRPVVPTRAVGDLVPGRVLHAVAHAIPDRQTGYTIRTHQTARAQALHGTDVHVAIQPGVVEGGEPVVTYDNVSYHRLEAPLRTKAPSDEWLQAYAESLLELTVDLRPQVLHAHSDFHNLLAARAVGDATGIPVVYEARGFWEETWLSGAATKYSWPGLEPLDHLRATYGSLPEAYTWRRDREREACRLADRVVTLAEVMSEEIQAGGTAPERISIAPNAVDVDEFPVLHRDESLADQLGIARDTVVIGYVSSFVEYEGIDVLIRAFHRLRRATATAVHLLLVGDGTEGPELRRLAAELGTAEVTFAGRVAHDEVARYYSLFDIFVVPRKPARVCHLVTPLKPFEAFSTGRSVVMSDVRALREIAQESGAARLFVAGDHESLAQVLSELVEDEDARHELSRRGSEWVRSSRTWEANADTYAKVYRDLSSFEA